MYAEHGSISSTVLYSVPNLTPHTQRWVLRHLRHLYITYRSAVPLLLSQLLSLFPQEIQPKQAHCNLCSFVDPRRIMLHFTWHITFKISLGCPFTEAENHLAESLLLAAQSPDSSFCPLHLTGLSSAPPDCCPPSPLCLGISISSLSRSLFLLQSNLAFF